MKAVSWFGCAALAAGVGTWVYLADGPDMPGREVRIKGGRTMIAFMPEILKKSHLSVNFAKAKEDCDMCSLPGFQIKESDLSFRVVDGKFASFDNGKISHAGSFKVTGGKKSFNAEELTIKTKEDGSLSLAVETAKGSLVAFDLRAPRTLHRSKAKELVMRDMDILISDELAAELGDMELAGEEVGTMTMYAQSEAVDGEGDVVVAEEAPAAGLDISLSAMSNLAVASNPVAKVGTYPNGRTGLTMSTTSCNVGTVVVPWNAPMQTTHPIIALNVYRLMNGRFEHVGWSWLKHGFLSTNSGGCGSCQNPGTGSLLGLGCSDTYGTGNNADRFYLGGRDEVNPFTGVWTCTNSWFSNYQNDCTRRNPAASTLDAVDHRIDVLDSDLGNAGARYFYEAYYILPNDINTYNNLGSREATLSWTGSSWSINPSVDTMIQGPAINRWGEMRGTTSLPGDGDVIVAVQTTDNGNGTWRYEYAVYNHNADRQVREFSVPMPYGATVTNIGFRDIDRNAANQWTATQQDHALVWSSPAFGSPNGNPLKYSSVFNFRFDANVPPATALATMGAYKPGSGTTMSAASKGPLFLVGPTSFSIINGSQRSGNLDSLSDLDSDKLVLGPVNSGLRSGTGISTSSFAPAGAITKITLGATSSNTLTTGGGAVQTIELWNWNTSAYEVVDTRPATNTDSSTTISITTNASRFVNSSTREVKAQIMHSTNIGTAGDRWTMAFDQIGVHFN